MTRSCRIVALTVPWLGSCIPSNVVAEQDRAVRVPASDVTWRAGAAADVHGLFESEQMTGDALRQLRKVFYHFADDGRFSGAALVAGPDGLVFQTLAGRWTLAGNELTLDEGEPARLEAAPDRLRLTSATGVVVLRRWEPRE